MVRKFERSSSLLFFETGLRIPHFLRHHLLPIWIAWISSSPSLSPSFHHTLSLVRRHIAAPPVRTAPRVLCTNPARKRLRRTPAVASIPPMWALSLVRPTSHYIPTDLTHLIILFDDVKYAFKKGVTERNTLGKPVPITVRYMGVYILRTTMTF
jgi:hypothetical protein